LQFTTQRVDGEKEVVVGVAFLGTDSAVRGGIGFLRCAAAGVAVEFRSGGAERAVPRR
jgi:hypothetical protein